MAMRRRSGNFPLLGMIVDRSSFDDEDQSLGNPHEEEERSFSDTPTVRKNGKVRRKLRWKPAGFRSKKKTALSHVPSSEESVSTHRSNANKSVTSFHTFNSSETPVQSNQTRKCRGSRGPITRPNYPESFEGMSTIDNEAGFIHSRMKPSQDASSKSDQSSLPSRGRVNSFDFQPITEENGLLNPYDDDYRHSTPFDPLGESIASYNSSPSLASRPPRDLRKLPLRAASMKELNLLELTPVTPTTTKKAVSSPNTASSSTSTPRTLNTTVSSRSSWDDLDGPLAHDDWAEDRQMKLTQVSSPLASPRSVSPTSGPDAAAGLGIESPARSTLQSTDEELPDFSVPRKSVSLPGRPPTAPLSAKRQTTPPHQLNPPRARGIMASPEAVKAKVSIDLDSPTSLHSMMSNSGLLLGQNYLPHQLQPEKPAHKMYNRPVDTTSISNGSHTMSGKTSSTSPISRNHSGDDDSLSTRSTVTNRSEMVIITNQQVQDVRAPSPIPIAGCIDAKPNRTCTGPVDVDDGAFVDAERHLRAIHEMAAEHLAHGEYEEALEVFEEILRGQKQRYGEKHYRVGTALHNIGIVHLKSGNFSDAVSTCKEAVKIRKEALVPNHPDVAVSLAQLGVAHLECQQYREALIAFREALQIRRDFLSPRHIKVAKLLNNIGCALFELEELDGAQLAFQEALDIQRETLRTSPTFCDQDEEHDDAKVNSNQILLSISSTLCNIGSIKLRWGIYEEASVALEEALLIQQSVLGDDHLTVVSTIKSIEFVDKAMEEGATEPPTAKESDEFAHKRSPSLSFALGEESSVVGCSSHDTGSSMTRFADMFRWDRSKRWYQKVGEDFSSPCGPILTADDAPEDTKWQVGENGGASIHAAEF